MVKKKEEDPNLVKSKDGTGKKSHDPKLYLSSSIFPMSYPFYPALSSKRCVAMPFCSFVFRVVIKLKACKALANLCRKKRNGKGVSIPYMSEKPVRRALKSLGSQVRDSFFQKETNLASLEKSGTRDSFSVHCRCRRPDESERKVEQYVGAMTRGWTHGPRKP